MARTTKNPGVFASDAETTIPSTPIVGESYRDTTLASIADGWPFKAIVDSAEFNQFMHQLTSFTQLIDKTGVLKYNPDIDYDEVPAYAVGNDGELYKSTAINGPLTTVRNPVGDSSGTWVAFSPAKASVSGSATFTNSSNNIALTDIGTIDGLEVGDVIQVSGSPANSTEFTVEVITDDDNVIVNQAHAGGTTTKSLTNETANVTITLLAKWYNAPFGLGQGVAITPKTAGVVYTNSTNRTIRAKCRASIPVSNQIQTFNVDGFEEDFVQAYVNNAQVVVRVLVPPNSIYELPVISGAGYSSFSEVR